MSVNALINGNVKTGQSPETQEDKLSFQVDLSVGFMLPPYLSGSRNQITDIIKLIKLDKKTFNILGTGKKYLLILEITKNNINVTKIYNCIINSISLCDK